MKRIIFLMPAMLLLTVAALASGNDCRNSNKFYGAQKNQPCNHNKAAGPGCYELNAFYGATRCQSCELKEFKIKPVKGAAICRKEAKKINAKAAKAAPAVVTPAPNPAPAAPAAPAKAAPAATQVKDDLAKVAVVTTTDKGTKLTFNTPILFGSASDKIQDSSKEEIQKIAKVLKKHPDTTVIVEGYTDSVGNYQQNLDLSKRRAKAVAEVLVGEGVAADKVGYKGFGSEKPIATNATKEGRAQNRRVELDIVSK